MQRGLSALLLLLSGCSAQVDVNADSATSAGSTTSATTTAAGTGGAGGSTGTGAGAGGSLEGGGGQGGGIITGSGGGPACPGVIDVDIDGNGEGPTVPLTHSCADDPMASGAYGYLGYLGEGGPKALILQGCNGPGEFGAPASLYFWGKLMGPGTTQEGHAQMTFSGQSKPATDDISLTVNSFGPVGGTISGDLAFTMTYADGSTAKVTAHFDVCRRPDGPPLP
ncbi:MAG: hypothetical protein U0359_23460 [Byssovorax sp.]